MAEECENCRFWENVDVHVPELGRCRVRSPSVSQVGIAQWPKVFKTEWCGEWKVSAKADEPRRKKIRTELMAELKAVYG